MNRPVSSVFADWRLSAWLGSYLACRSDDSCCGAHRDWHWSLFQRSGSPVSFPMQWSQVVWCKVSACNGWETISSLVELSVEEGTCTGPWCCDPAWGRRPDGREESLTIKLFVDRSHGMQGGGGGGHAEAKTRDKKAFPIVSYAAGLCLRLGLVRP